VYSEDGMTCEAVATAMAQQVFNDDNPEFVWQPSDAPFLPWIRMGRMYEDRKHISTWPGEAEYIELALYNDADQVVVFRFSIDYGHGVQPVFMMMDDAQYFRSRSWEDISDFLAPDMSKRDIHLSGALWKYIAPSEAANPLSVIPEKVRELRNFYGAKDIAFVRLNAQTLMIVRQREDGLIVVYEGMPSRTRSVSCILFRQ
jgi:hypothetical protein